jgi:periplasmic divalent cation tolerance protein
MKRLTAITMLLLFTAAPLLGMEANVSTSSSTDTLTDRSELIRSAVRDYLDEKTEQAAATKERNRKIILNVGKAIAILIALLVTRAIIKAIGRGVRKEDPEAPFGVYITTKTEDEARSIASTLVEEHLASDAKILPGIRSIYAWEGKTEDASETLLLLKTVLASIPRLISRAEELHTYNVPDIVALPIHKTHSDMADWVREPDTSS